MSVSRALRGIEGVSIEMRERIIKAADDLGYQPNNNARSLAVSRSKLIGVSIPTLFDEVFADVLANARTGIERNGFDVIVETSAYDMETESAWIDRIMKWSPAGLILTGIDHVSTLKERILEAAIPVVEIWDYSDNPLDVCVGVNHFEVGYLAANHLLQAGYRNACLIGIAENRDPRAEKRFQGFYEIFSSLGDIDIRRISAEPSFEAGHNTIMSLYEEGNNNFDCFFFLNDHLAFGGLCALESLGIQIPSDVGIVGFNNLGINNVLNKKITTITTNRTKIGELTAQLLLARINGVDTPTSICVSVELCVGDTSRPV